MMLTYVISSVYADTLVRGFPFEPSHGSWVTAALMILLDPNLLRKDFKKRRKLAESADE